MTLQKHIIRDIEDIENLFYEFDFFVDPKGVWEYNKGWTDSYWNKYNKFLTDNEKHIKNALKDFPAGLTNIPNVIEIYRLLSIDKREDIKLNLGRFWTSLSTIIKDKHFHESINVYPDIEKTYVLIGTIKEVYIDKEKSLMKRISFPEEFEITLDTGFRMKEVYTCKYEDFNEKDPKKSNNLIQVI